MTRILRNHWPLLGIGLLLIVVALYVIGTQRQVLRESLLPHLASGEGLKLKNIHYTQDNPDEGLKWILDANEVRFSKDRSCFSFRKFRLKLEPENRPTVELEGKSGEYNKDSGEINLRGDLRGYTNNGYRIITEHLLYNQKEGYLKTEETVEIFGPFFSMSGRGLFFNLHKETLKILSDATTRIIKGSLLL